MLACLLMAVECLAIPELSVWGGIKYVFGGQVFQVFVGVQVEDRCDVGVQVFQAFQVLVSSSL
jgi:hypothetical protein